MTHTARIAPGPQSYSFFGCLDDFQEDRLGFLLKLSHEFGDIVRYRIGPWTTHLLSSPELVRHVLIDRSDLYSIHTYTRSMFRRAFGDGLLTSEGPDWKSQRTMLNPFFRAEMLRLYEGAILDETDGTASELRDHCRTMNAVDIAAAMYRLALRIIARVLLGKNYADSVRQTLERTVGVITTTFGDYSRRRIPWPYSVPTPANRRLRAALRTLDRIIYSAIDLSASTRNDDTLLSFLKSTAPVDGVEGRRAVRDQILTMLVTGHETVATALTWVFHVFATRPQVCLAVRDEVRFVLGSRRPATSDMPALPYTNSVIAETLRLYPPIWLIGRRALAADVIHGCHVPKGGLVLMSPYVLHRHPKFWNDPEAFRPERFRQSGQSELASRQLTYIPFGAGPRACIGRYFALVEMMLVVTSLVRELTFVSMDDQEPCLDPSATLRPLGGLRLRCTTARE